MEVMSKMRKLAVNPLRKTWIALLTVSVLTFVSLTSALAASSGSDVFTGNPIADIVEKTSPAVVNIDTKTMVRQPLSPFANDPFLREFLGDQLEKFTRLVPMKGKGSGFIVSKDGYILTNNHVVAGADEITVSMSDGKTYPAKVVGTDPSYDLAVIKIEGKNLPVLPLGDSDKVQVGEWVIAIGNPFGFESTVTVGVVSAKNRSIRARDFSFDGFLQTDAAINPGNSGGPLLNLKGEVIGINTAIIPYAQGIGFAVPVNMAKQVLDDLVKYGRVKRGYLGVYVQPLTKEFADVYGIQSENGAVVADVVPGSPAEKAGLMRGDVIVEVDGKKVEDDLDLTMKIRSHLAGDKVNLKILRRGGLERKISVVLGNIPGSEGGRESFSESLKKIGVRVEPLSDAVRKQKDLPPSVTGVMISEVTPGSLADGVGLRSGDIIVEVNGNKVEDVDSFVRSLPKTEGPVVLAVWRDGRVFYVSFRL